MVTDGSVYGHRLFVLETLVMQNAMNLGALREGSCVQHD